MFLRGRRYGRGPPIHHAASSRSQAPCACAGQVFGASAKASTSPSLYVALFAAESSGQSGAKLVTLVTAVVSPAAIAQACPKLRHRALALSRTLMHQRMRPA